MNDDVINIRENFIKKELINKKIKIINLQDFCNSYDHLFDSKYYVKSKYVDIFESPPVVTE